MLPAACRSFPLRFNLSAAPQPDDIPDPSAKKKREEDKLRSTQAIDSLLSSLDPPVAKTVSFKAHKSGSEKSVEGREASPTTEI